MKLFNTILLSLSAVFLIIGTHQAIIYGVQYSYFFFMMSSGFFLWFTFRKKNEAVQKVKKQAKGPALKHNAKRKNK